MACAAKKTISLPAALGREIEALARAEGRKLSGRTCASNWFSIVSPKEVEQ
jgi:hypothetical protein